MADTPAHTAAEEAARGRTGGLGTDGGFIGESPEEEAERLAKSLIARQRAIAREGGDTSGIEKALKALREADNSVDGNSLSVAIGKLRTQVLTHDIVAGQVVGGETTTEVPEGAKIGNAFQSVGQQAARDAETARRAAAAEATQAAESAEADGSAETEGISALRAEFEESLARIAAGLDEERKVTANLEAVNQANKDALLRLDAIRVETDALEGLRQPGAGLASLFSQRRPSNRGRDPLPSAIGALLANQGLPIFGNIQEEPIFIDPNTLQGSNNVFRDLIRSISQRDFNALSADPTLQANFNVLGNILGGDPSRALATRAAASPREGRIRSVLFGGGV